MRKFIYSNLLLAFFAMLFCAPAFAQHVHDYFDPTGGDQASRDISGSFKGSWTDLYKRKGEMEIKIYSQYTDTYVGYMKLTDKNGEIYTGTINISLTGDYFNGYYTPSVYASDEAATALECQLMIYGRLVKEKKGYLFEGEGVSASCYENNILELELEEEELLAAAANKDN